MNQLFRNPLFLVASAAFLVVGSWLVLRGMSGANQVTREEPKPPARAEDKSQSSVATSPSNQTAKGYELDSPDKQRNQTNPQLALSTSFPPGFAGTAVCADCHQDRYDSYQKTTHSRSLQRVDAEQHADNDGFDHPKSGRSYETRLTQKGELRHREYLRIRNGDTSSKFESADLPVEYEMGSGAFAKAYLLRDGPFLLQSPVTWYSADQNLAIAPGYDAVNHRGFNRVIEDQCLFCHAGIVSREKPQHPVVLEESIGCERCHGPSGEHATHHLAHRDGAPPNEVPDAARSLNPSTLDRVRLESLCAQCHLDGDVVVHPDDGNEWDFAPGDDFAETRLAYKADWGVQKDPFASHFDQMWQSKCYQKSDTLTCVSCHDPHHDAPNENLSELRRNQCFACHDNLDCGVDLRERTSAQQNRCVACHMPSVRSRAVHSATTNHRIAVHVPSNASETTGNPKPVVLRRLQPAPESMSPEQIQRYDTMAKGFWLVDQKGSPEKTRGLNAAKIETELRSSELPLSADVLALLARLARLQAEQSEAAELRLDHMSRAAEYAKQSLALPTVSHDSKLADLEILASHLLDSRNHADSVQAYIQLVSLRRSAIDFYNLGLGLGKMGQLGPAERAMREAIRIDRSYPLPYRSMSVLYRSRNPQLAAQMESTARMLIERAAKLSVGSNP